MVRRRRASRRTRAFWRTSMISKKREVISLRARATPGSVVVRVGVEVLVAITPAAALENSTTRTRPTKNRPTVPPLSRRRRMAWLPLLRLIRPATPHYEAPATAARRPSARGRRRHGPRTAWPRPDRGDRPAPRPGGASAGPPPGRRGDPE